MSEVERDWGEIIKDSENVFIPDVAIPDPMDVIGALRVARIMRNGSPNQITEEQQAEAYEVLTVVRDHFRKLDPLLHFDQS